MKHCSRCNSDKPLTDFRKDATRKDGKYPYCAACLAVIGRDYRKRNPGQNTARFVAWKKRNPERAAVLVRSSSKKYRAGLKSQVMLAYGGAQPKCACCGEAEPDFLTVDHVFGGGNKHRREISVLGWNFYKWLIDNKFPSGFQLLCYNCNCAKGRFGECPHTRKRAEVA